MRRSLLLVAILLLVVINLIGQSAALSGKVNDEENKEALSFANVALYHNGIIKSVEQTDYSGQYHFSNLDPGTYDVEVSYVGYRNKKIQGVKIFDGKFIELNIKVSTDQYNLPTAEVLDYRVPLIKIDQGPDETITSEQIKNSPTQSINTLVSTVSGVTSSDDGEPLSFRGGRPEATKFFIDGMPVQHSLIQISEIDQLQVVTGGIEARYGDVTGGIVSITSKGPSSQFSGGIEMESSNLLDAYNNNILGLHLSGPLLRNKKNNNPIIGFRLSGRYTYRLDDDPSGVSIYQVKDDVLKDLQANPLTTIGGNTFSSADFLTNEDIDVLKVRPNEALTMYDFTAKLDAQLTRAIDISLGGSYSGSEDYFTPNENSANLASWRAYNSQNNPADIQDDYRLNFRFRHKLSGTTSTEDQVKHSRIQNVSYILQASYENRKRNIADPNHLDNYFDYGYIGKFDVDYIPVFRLNVDNSALEHVDYREVLRGYDINNSSNPVLANYNNPFNLPQNETLNPLQPNYAIQNVFGENDNITIDNLYAINGRVSDIYDHSWGLHQNVGTVYNRALQRDNDVFVLNASTAFDVVLAESRHNIQFGLAHESRTNREYDVRDPSRLWTAARQNANAHIQGIDVENATVLGLYSELFGDPNQTPPTIINPYNDAEILSLTISEDPDARFYKTIRSSLGLGLDEYVNIDGLSPDQLNMSMFSAKELNDQFILDYYGYDYLGNEYNGNFEDFFTARDVDGIRTFSVAPSRPLYSSVYLQDKFKFRDIIFRIGVRMDRYDANTKVLKDPYSLYAIQGADDFHTINGGDRPGNIGDDFAVYTQTDNGDEVQAYRSGDDWYHKDGTPANGPQEIDGIRTGLVFPKYEDSNAHTANYIKDDQFDVNASFKDYEAEVNIMPRLAFSFPISEKANFFAHYDVLVQRPPSNTIATALDYFYFTERTGNQTFNNPDLRPERTVDYEVGFQQALTRSSALKISAYYKEFRDMIQLRTFFPVPIVGSYTTFDNQDFGTVKGFSLTYDLRRTRNFTINANYTIQFADGTGSNSESQRGLTNRGNIRTLFPVDSDERHHINFITDYRFPKNRGPRIAGKYVFQNTGINLQLKAVSGRPYTAKQVVTEELGGSSTVGAINGARKPWNQTVSMRINKRFDVSEKLKLNVYLRISNLLDTRNVIDVYPVTGRSDEDGYLSGSFGQDQLDTIENSAREIEAYQASYQWRLLNSDFYSLPRRMFIGANMDF